MGYMRSHAIIVTSWSEKDMRRAHEKALEIFGQKCPRYVGLIHDGEAFRNLVTELRKTPVNGHWSFAVLPDGSKEGWEDSDWGDALRSQLIDFLKQPTYEGGSNAYDWVEVQFGDDWQHTFVTTHSEERVYDEEQDRSFWPPPRQVSEYERGYQRGLEDAKEEMAREAIRQPQDATTGAAAVYGKWPGDESEEELLAALDDIE